jgi:hypothetical protein
MKFEMRKFDMRKMCADSTCVFIGKRATGKSWVLKDMMYHLREIPMGIVISPTECANRFFGNFIPGILIYEEYHPDIIAKFVDRQRKITDQYNQEKLKYGRTDIDPRAFLILDDCMYDKAWVNDKNMRFLFMNGRHINAQLSITLQYSISLGPALRGNCDFVFICRENIISMREKLYKSFAGMFPTFDVFNQVMNQCTQNYEVLVIDNRTQSNALSDQVFWYKATQRVFQMCSKELWHIQEKEDERKELGFAHTKDDDEEEDYDPAVISAKKRTIPFNVRKAY